MESVQIVNDFVGKKFAKTTRVTAFSSDKV